MIIKYPVKKFTPVPGLRGVTSAGCDLGLTLLILVDGQVLQYGNKLPSTILPNVSDVVNIVITDNSPLLIRSDGRVYRSNVRNNEDYKLIEDVDVRNIISAIVNNGKITFLNSSGEVLFQKWDEINDAYKYTALPEINNVIQLASGIDYALALRVDGRVSIKGRMIGLDMVEAKTFAEIEMMGLDTTEFKTFTEIEQLSNIVSIAGGWKHAVALRTDGHVYGWGDNATSALGSRMGHKDRIIIFPLRVISKDKFRDVRCGDKETFLISADGSVIGAGRNNTHELGLPNKLVPFTKLDVPAVTSSLGSTAMVK